MLQFRYAEIVVQSVHGYLLAKKQIVQLFYKADSWNVFETCLLQDVCHNLRGAVPNSIPLHYILLLLMRTAWNEFGTKSIPYWSKIRQFEWHE